MHGNVQHLNPAGLHKNPAYTQAVVVSGNATTIYVGGQNAVDASGNIVGKGDIRAQTEKVLKNLETALEAGGAELQHVVKWNVYILHGQSAQAGFEAFQQVWWLVAISPLALYVIVALVLRLMQGQWLDLSLLGQVDFLPNLGWGALFLWLFTYGIGEETGWRGYALPRLQKKRSALSATFILWVF
ncbi:MAG: hypothetical protein CVU41_16805 [Chloroflexi bacterium HGW-Chloroflexi-3]|nr:MAG: hypothetical protein CVU41_16805 [Chloroflexi bacterium HGW-Chloroflexi-3]